MQETVSWVETSLSDHAAFLREKAEQMREIARLHAENERAKLALILGEYAVEFERAAAELEMMQSRSRAERAPTTPRLARRGNATHT